MPPADRRRHFWDVALATEILCVVVAGYVVIVPDHVKDRIRSEARALWTKATRAKRSRREHSAMVWEAHQLAEACPHELSDEVERLATEYNRRHGSR